MPSPRHHGAQCVYCVFRARRLALQSLRLPRSSTKRVFHSTPFQSTDSPQVGSKIRMLKSRDLPNQFKITPTFSPSRSTDGYDRKGRAYKRLDEKRGPSVTRNSFGAQHKRHLDFESQLQIRVELVKEELKNAPLVDELRKEKVKAGLKPESFEDIWKNFTRETIRPNLPFLGVIPNSEHDKVLSGLRNAFATRGVYGLDDRLKYTFYTHLISPRFTASDLSNQRALADLRYPSEWFPATRKAPRVIHLHVGPTNSGKTYHALQRLEQAEIGVYAGPLRLLAHEVYTRLNAKGKPCNLVTGEERRITEREDGDRGHLSACTVEMMPLNYVQDVAVIDEIQMIGNAERGWAWTQAFLGVRAREVHLCGEERTLPLVKEICASLGEKLHIHRYERLTPLDMEDNSLKGRLKDLRKGDCVVSFSVMGIHALRQQIERATGKKVATVYGSLPPETRAQQARLFNDPDNEYDYLVASDAVGMGLNLAIKRIVFEASNKWDGFSRRTLAVADIKQIAGRAGRYKIASFKDTEDQNDNQEESLATEDLGVAKGEQAPVVVTADEATTVSAPEPAIRPGTEEAVKGLITTLEQFDYPIIRAAMSAQPEPIRSAGIFPPSPILERFASYFPPYTPFSYILTRLHEVSQMHPRFHLCGLKDQVWLADLIEHVKGLTVTDRNIICSCPASMTDKDLWIQLAPAFANCIAEQTGGAIYDIEALPLEILEAEVSASRGYLRELEQLHKGVVGYLWLSYRFAGVFYTRGLAFHVKSLVEAKIEEVLSKFSFTEANRRKMAAVREKQLMQEMEETAKAEEEAARAKEERQRAIDFDTNEVEGEEIGGVEATRPEELEPRHQTSLTSGGDHVGGEQDIGYEEPLDDEDVERDNTKISTFARWREQETRSVDEIPHAEAAEFFSKVVAEAEEDAREASIDDKVDVMSEDRPSIEAVMPNVVEAEASTSEDDKALSPEQDPSNIEASFTSEIGLDSDQPPLQTQQAQPSLTESRVPGEELVTTPQHDEPNQKPTGFSQFRAGVPPKHLAHLDIDAKQDERDWASRP